MKVICDAIETFGAMQSESDEGEAREQENEARLEASAALISHLQALVAEGPAWGVRGCKLLRNIAMRGRSNQSTLSELQAEVEPAASESGGRGGSGEGEEDVMEEGGDQWKGEAEGWNDDDPADPQPVTPKLSRGGGAGKQKRRRRGGKGGSGSAAAGSQSAAARGGGGE